MRINSMISSAYSNQSSIIPNSSQSSKHTSSNQSISTAKIDSLEISSEAYKMQESPRKMSATSGKDILEITKGNSENSYVVHFKDSTMVSRAVSRGYITIDGKDIQLSDDVKQELISIDKQAETKRVAAYKDYIMEHDMAVAQQQGEALRVALDEYLSILLGQKYDESSLGNDDRYKEGVSWSQFEWRYYETTMDISMEDVPTIQNIQVNEIILNEITNLSDADKVELERRAALGKISPKEALMAALATAPNDDDVERSKALAAKFAPIQNKMFSGKKLTTEEKQFLQKHYPEFAATAQRIEQEIEQLRNQVKHSKSKEDASRLIMERKMQLMNSGEKDGFLLFMMPAIDEVF